jgi:hypothetical protein
MTRSSRPTITDSETHHSSSPRRRSHPPWRRRIRSARPSCHVRLFSVLAARERISFLKDATSLQHNSRRPRRERRWTHRGEHRCPAASPVRAGLLGRPQLIPMKFPPYRHHHCAPTMKKQRGTPARYFAIPFIWISLVWSLRTNIIVMH